MVNRVPTHCATVSKKRKMSISNVSWEEVRGGFSDSQETFLYTPPLTGTLTMQAELLGHVLATCFFRVISAAPQGTRNIYITSDRSITEDVPF